MEKAARMPCIATLLNKMALRQEAVCISAAENNNLLVKSSYWSPCQNM